MRRELSVLSCLGVGVWLVACGLNPDSPSTSGGSQQVTVLATSPAQQGAISLRLDRPTVLPRAVSPRVTPPIQQVIVTVHLANQIVAGPLTFPAGGLTDPLQFLVPGVPVGKDLTVAAVGLDATGSEVLDFERSLRLDSDAPLLIRGSLTPIADVLSGIAVLQPVQPVPSKLMETFRSFEAEGFTLFEDKLLYPPSLAKGWKVKAGNQEVRVEQDGTFRLVRPDASITKFTLMHPTHLGYQADFPLDQLSSGQRATQPIMLVQPFDGGCGMSPGDEEFCRASVPAPKVQEFRARTLNIDPSITTDDCDFVIPAPTEATQLDRGHYPKPFDTALNGDFREVECHQVCEQDNGKTLVNRLPLVGEESKYLGSTCHLFVRAGYCPNENTLSGIFNVAQAGIGLVTNSASRLASLLSFGSLPKRPFPSLANTLNVGDELTCQDNHKGRECQQVVISDISLDFRDSGKVNYVLRAPHETPVIPVRPGERVDFVVHNNGGFGVTLVQLRQRDIPGNLVRTYREVPFSDTPLPQVSPLRADMRSHSIDGLLRSAPIFGEFKSFSAPSELDVTPTSFGFFSGEVKEIRHFFESGILDSPTPCKNYRYYCDVAVQYRVPTTARPGTRDHYAFSTDNCEVPVIFEVVGDEGGPSPSGSPSPSETPSPTESPSSTPSPSPVDLVQVGPAISNSHIIGVSPCPQMIGSLAIGNRTNENVAIEVSVNHFALQIESPSAFTLPGNGATTRDITFNCATQQSIQASLTVTATRISDGVQEVEIVPVNLNIQ